MAKVLVTGGAGYIGSHACRRLAAAGHTPICLDNFSTGWREAVRFGPAVDADLLDAAAVRAAFETWRPDAVMHFAALSLVGESVSEPDRYWRNNVCGAMALLDAMRAEKVTRLVFSSTAATYGDVEDALIREEHPQRPSNPYGGTKLAVERMIADFSAAYGISAVVFRYFNVAGGAADGSLGEQHRPETHLIPLVLETALGRREAIAIFGDDYPTPDGTCVRDYLHVEDLVDAHMLGLERLLGGGPALTANLGIGRGYSVREVIEHARAVTGRPIAARIGPRRPGDPARLVCDPSRARRELGWSPQRADLGRMIADAWTWAQGDGYER